MLSFGRIPAGLSIALIFGAIAFAGSGGGQNLCQSNWIRDKGFGMGQYVPKLVSPITGAATAAPIARSYIFETTPANMARWRSWWRFANVEQVFSFVLVTIITIGFTSMLSHSTLFGEPDLPNNVSFLRIEAQRMEAMVGRWFGVLFLAIGAFSLFGSAMGIIDYTSRLAADILKTTYLPRSTMSESRMYSGSSGAWWARLRHPARRHVAADHAARHLGVDWRHIMFLYSMLLIALNKRMLPEAIRINAFRTATLLWSTLLFGSLAIYTIYDQLQRFIR
jgi:hypothetical protein